MPISNKLQNPFMKKFLILFPISHSLIFQGFFPSLEMLGANLSFLLAGLRVKPFLYLGEITSI